MDCRKCEYQAAKLRSYFPTHEDNASQVKSNADERPTRREGEDSRASSALHRQASSREKFRIVSSFVSLMNQWLKNSLTKNGLTLSRSLL